MIRITVNGVASEVAATTVGELMVTCGIDPKARFVAVAVNGVVVRRDEWGEVGLRAGDAVEIVRPLQGG
jgi:sulfur carrier protein